jgi:carbamoyl-phosphate synthase large subunit
MVTKRSQDGSIRPRCVLIPGAGGDAGIGAIKALRLAGYRGRIVATDTDPLSPGLELADTGTVLPPAASPDFLERAIEFIHDEEVDVILPTSGFDTPVYARHEGELRGAGVTVIGCGPFVMETCMDKWRFYECVRRDFPVPSTYQRPVDDLEFPCFVKPVRGKGSRRVSVCRDRDTLDRRLTEHDDLLIQEYLPGVEYTVDVLSDLDGRPLVAVPRIRLAVKEGISVRGQILHDEEIESLCLRLAAALLVKGPVCMQLKRDRDGAPRFIEVNPRMGGGTIFAALAGVNMAALSLALAAGRPLPPLRFSEITVVRYFEELVLIGEDRRPRRASGARAGVRTAAHGRRVNSGRENLA